MRPSFLTILLLSQLLLLFICGVFGKSEIDWSTDCGRFLNFKYFLGNKTEFDDYPWLALLEYDTPKGKQLSCGGALITPRHVLTAAFCVVNFGRGWSLSGVRLGEYDTTTDPDCLLEGDKDNTTRCAPGALNLNISSVVVHEAYSTKTYGHDLALIELSEDVPLSEYIWPICLPSESTIPQKYHVAGWGRLAGHRGSKMKLRATLEKSNDSECRDWYKKERVLVAGDQFCAAGMPCIGDSGGPIMGVRQMADGSHKMAVYGLLTMNARFCEVQGWPGIYTNILPYGDWITDKIQASSTENDITSESTPGTTKNYEV